MAKNEVKMVIGSCGSYNACNNRAFGSKWLTLNDYEDWEEIAEELTKQGFELDGIDAELFVQDLDGLPSYSTCYDTPQNLFNLLKSAGVLDDEAKYNTMFAFVEALDWGDFKNRVETYDNCWDDDVFLYENYDWYDLGYYFLKESGCYDIPDYLENYIDYEKYGNDLSFDGFYEVSGGIVEIR